MRIATALLLVALLAPFAAPQAEAATGPVVWEYTVTARADGQGTIHVDLSILGAKDRIRTLTFHPSEAPYPISNFRVDGAPGTVIDVASDVHTVSYDAYVNKAAPRSGEFTSYLGLTWGVVRAEALSVPFNYTFPTGTRPVWDARVTFALPPGWNAATPWPRDGAGHRYELPAGAALPRGFVALGAFTETKTTAAGREVRLVALGEALPFAPRLVSHLDKSAPYLSTVYGDVPGDTILVVSAPDPMLRGGLGATDSFYLHDTSDLRTAAHEWTHVWQRFSGRDLASDSSIWLPEGAADLHGTISLFASGEWSLDAVNAFLQRPLANRTKEPWKSTTLAAATYSSNEEVAYGKGLTVLSALDEQIAFNTQGRAGLPDLLQALNRRAASDDDRDVRLSNAQIKAEVATLTGREFRPFFDAYVGGTSWPGLSPLEAKGRLVVVNITTEPAKALAGRDVTIRATIDNRGYAAATATFQLLLDGAPQGARAVTLGVGGRATAQWTITAPNDGEHDLKVGNLTRPFLVAAPARLVPTDVSTIPARPAAAAPADVLVSVRNDGDFPTAGTVVLLVDEVAVGERNVTVGANSTTIAAFEHVFPDEGPRRLTARVYGDGRVATLNATLTIGARDRDGDGVADARDAYPDNGKLSEKGVVNDARNLVPAWGAWAAAGAAGAALARSRR